MRIVHVIPHVHDEASGPAYSVPALCAALARRGHEVELLCLAAGAAPAGVRVTVEPEWPVLRRFSVSPALARTLRRRAAEVDLVHNHSLWAMPNVAAGLVVPGSRAVLVTSPRGTLLPVARSRSRWSKALIWPWQRPAVARARLLHATSAPERDALLAAGFERPVALVPNGIDVPDARSTDRRPTRRLLYLGRIHPVKALDLLVAAWARIAGTRPGWELVIAGKGEPAHVEALRDAVGAAGANRVVLRGPAFGKEKARLYASADLFVLPSRSENFGMVVAEALAQGVPVVVSRGAPWAGVETERCGWWTGSSVDALAATLAAATGSDDEVLRAMGERGRDWMRREFGWGPIAARMDEAYRWALEGGAAPSTVSLPR